MAPQGALFEDPRQGSRDAEYGLAPGGIDVFMTRKHAKIGPSVDCITSGCAPEGGNTCAACGQSPMSFSTERFLPPYQDHP
jgi:hypothetical protein